MNTKKVLSTALLAVAIVFSVSTQKFKYSSEFLKNETKINVVFDYNRTAFDGDSQKDYYEDKSKSWIEKWERKRGEGNVNAFLKSFNDELKQICMNTESNYPEVQCTSIVNVIDCDFGAFACPFSVPAKLKCTLQIVKTGTAEVILSITLKESQNPNTVIGIPVDFDRMYLAFGEMREETGEKFVKALK